MSKPSPVRDRTTNWSDYNAALLTRGSLLIRVHKEMAVIAPHEGCPGHPPVFSDAAIQFSRSIKVLIKLPLRQNACLKAFGERIAARDPDRQTAEIHIRIALMNRYSALAPPRSFA